MVVPRVMTVRERAGVLSLSRTVMFRLCAEGGAELVCYGRLAEEEVDGGIVRAVEVERLVAVRIEGVDEAPSRLPDGPAAGDDDVHFAGCDGRERAVEVAGDRVAVVLDAARLVLDRRAGDRIAEGADRVDEQDVLDEVAVLVAEARPVLMDRGAVDDVEAVRAAAANNPGALGVRVREVEVPGGSRERARCERQDCC